MSTLIRILERTQFGLLAVVLLLAPWLFGAWEMWWFWPFAVLLFVATALFALRVCLAPEIAVAAETPPAGGTTRVRPLLYAFLGSYMLFLGYAAVRFCQAEVFMDAERSFLLFVTPLLVGLQVAWGLNRAQRRTLLLLLMSNIVLFGLYGIANHILTGSERVLWAEGFPQYYKEGRASGAYYCPDHFAGVMELGLCLGLAVLLDRRSRATWRTGGAVLAVLAVLCVGLSKSRGGGLTVLVIGAAALVWGFRQWPAEVRWYLRGAVAVVVLAAMAVLWQSELGYVQRFKQYFVAPRAQELTVREQADWLLRRFRTTSRGRMFGGAWRAWKSRPIWGIGPGMHQNLWPRFAATPDGDRDEGVWPSQPNYRFHSYEVHSDWLQLLEEYGLIGLVLFVVPAGLYFSLLSALCPGDDMTEAQRRARMPLAAAPLAALLAFVAMAFHSLGDFNLQLPATTWVFAAILALPIGKRKTTNRYESEEWASGADRYRGTL